eukprot:GILK01008189.1.p1 GENE.GILK01008189.1~~GILK01008189.1.p1  ORF type:complete len:513 (-),score=59.79 GILK01008189.1:269-1765(-)
MANAEAHHGFEYDLIVIGGGSGGLACSKEAATFGAKVAVFDYVDPSPAGTVYGLGGTCVNVGCIPKKIMHQSALLGGLLKDARSFGWRVPDVQHEWTSLVENVNSHIYGLNMDYRKSLHDKSIDYYNEFATFVDQNTIEGRDIFGKVTRHTAANFLLAVGGRPIYPSIPGVEHCISSDDIFQLEKPPGKTLVVGASYIGLECAGFIHGMGMEATVMVRSILLRGFDREMAAKVGEYMEREGINFIWQGIPKSIEKTPEGRLKVSYQLETEFGTLSSDAEFDTVLFAVGRQACTQKLGLDRIGLAVESNGKIAAVNEQTKIPHIYVVGDVLQGRPELTPVAIMAGRLLARRLYNESSRLMDYNLVPTTVFTPLEYGCVGLSEDAAIEAIGEENVEVYMSGYETLEMSVARRQGADGEIIKNPCFCKLVCDKTKNERVLGFHVLGPNAGEITQGFAVAMRLGATKEDFDLTVGIHPTQAEELTLLTVTKSSGESAVKTSC